jgi:squalene synthase HpnC
MLATAVAAPAAVPALPDAVPAPAESPGDEGDGCSHSPEPGPRLPSATQAIAHPAVTSPDDAELAAGGRLAVLSRSAGENFPVAPRLLPAALRRDLLAIYGYARLVDQLGDEAPGDRDRLLVAVAADVDRLVAGTPRLSLVADLLPLVRRGAPLQPLRDLIEANRRDQRRHRYRNFDELLDYCRYSADPVGRLVLHAVGAATPERIALSDRVCSALQVIEHLQDVGEDFRRGRVYLPADDRERYRVGDADLAAVSTSPRLRSLLALEAGRAEDLLTAGAPLVGTLGGAARIAVAGFVAGGRATLAALEDAGYDVLAAPVTASRRRIARTAARCWLVGR